MACESTGINDRRLNQFDKIRLLNNMANAVANYGEQSGVQKFFETVDMNCGAIPDGDFASVIDLNSPHQFLSLYMHVAEARFAFAVSNLLKINEKFYGPIEAFCKETGKLNSKKVDSIYDAFELYEFFVLDGMPCDETKEILFQKDSEISWKKLIDTHKEFWDKYDGDVKVYYRLLKAFASGLFEGSGFTFEIDDENQMFSIKKAE